MSLHLFAGLRVRDFQAVRPWYERLLGEPTFFPHATEAVWTLAEDRSVYVVEHADGAGNSVVTVFPRRSRRPRSRDRCSRARARRARDVRQRRTQGDLPRSRRQRAGVRRRTARHPLIGLTGGSRRRRRDSTMLDGRSEDIRGRRCTPRLPPTERRSPYRRAMSERRTTWNRELMWRMSNSSCEPAYRLVKNSVAIETSSA
jgi:hypothetical protein